MQDLDFSFLEKILFRGNHNSRILLRASFELTYQCNFHCRHCYIPDYYRLRYKNIQLDTAEVCLVLGQLADLGCLYIVFTGGEPFLRRDILEILEHAQKKGFRFRIGTNGSLVTEKIARRLYLLGTHRVDVTLPSLKEEVFNEITQSKGYFKKVLKGIELLKKNKVPLGLRTCVFKENQDEIFDLQSLAEELKAIFRVDYFISPRLDGDMSPYAYRAIGIPKKQRLGIKMKRVKKTFYFKDLFYCGAAIKQAAITPSGELKPCLLIDNPKYKILTFSLKNAWDKMGFWINRGQDANDYICLRCSLRSYCKICPARSWLYAGNFNSCDPLSREFAIRLKYSTL